MRRIIYLPDSISRNNDTWDCSVCFCILRTSNSRLVQALDHRVHPILRYRPATQSNLTHCWMGQILLGLQLLPQQNPSNENSKIFNWNIFLFSNNTQVHYRNEYFTSVPLDESSLYSCPSLSLDVATSYSSTSIVAMPSVVYDSVSLVSRQKSENDK